MTVAAAVSDGRASFQEASGGGPPAAALAGIALGAGPSALFAHPASPAGLARAEAYFTYDQLYAGLDGVGVFDRGALAASFPTKVGVLSTGLWRYRGGGLKEERVIGLGLAHEVRPGLRLGLLLKHLHHSYLPNETEAADPIFSRGTSEGAVAVDIGAHLALTETLRASLAARNLNAPDVGLRTEDRVLREFQAGVAWKTPLEGLSVLADVSWPSPAIPRIGVEKVVYRDMVVFRAGLNPYEFAAGMGLRIDSFGFDYALSLRRNLLSDNLGTHSLGVSFAFGGKKG